MNDLLGKHVRCRITGYTGTATAVAAYLDDPTPSVRVTRADRNGVPEDVWIIVPRLDVVDDTALGFGVGA